MPHETSSPIPSRAELAYVVGIDIGMESCMMCCLTMDKRQVIKPSKFSNEADGFEWLFEHLDRLKTSADQILIGLEATSRDARKPVSRPLETRLSAVLIASGTDPRLCPSRGDCVRKQTVWMLRPLREPCSAERHALATFLAIK